MHIYNVHIHIRIYIYIYICVSTRACEQITPHGSCAAGKINHKHVWNQLFNSRHNKSNQELEILTSDADVQPFFMANDFTSDAAC